MPCHVTQNISVDDEFPGLKSRLGRCGSLLVPHILLESQFSAVLFSFAPPLLDSLRLAELVAPFPARPRSKSPCWVTSYNELVLLRKIVDLAVEVTVITVVYWVTVKLDAAEENGNPVTLGHVDMYILGVMVNE